MAGTPKYPLNRHWLETRGFRPEIQGLRALALFLVVSYHIWFGRVSGGVDVFLFISAFLLSLSSLRKINEGKPIAPVKYWLHVFQRLIPAAFTVVVGTVLGSFFFLSPARMMSIVQDAIASIFYFLNWRLAFNAVDYYAQDASTKTPLQHFWSLSMQGQIFILWPLIFVVLALLARRYRLPLLPTALAIFGFLFAISLSFSVYETYSPAQGFAYFDTRARLWEFAGGTLLAILSFVWKAPERLRVPAGWIGLLGLVSCGFVLPVEQAFPGFLALWPLCSAALVILAGQTNSAVGVDRLLSSRPMLKLGDISYALYLVHWPVFIFYSSSTHQEHPNFWMGSALILLSMAIAWCIHRFIEQPLRRIGTTQKSTSRVAPYPKKKQLLTSMAVKNYVLPAGVILACFVVAGSALVGAKSHVQAKNDELAGLAEIAGSDDFPGALAIGQGNTEYRHEPIPQSDPHSQYAGIPSGSCVGDFALKHSELAGNCGVEVHGETSSPKIILVGASHVGQSEAIYGQLAEDHGFNLMDMHMGACRFPIEAEPHPDQASDACKTYDSLIMDEVLYQHPAVVGLMITQTDPQTNQEVVVNELEGKIKQFTDAGIKVIGLRDNPRWTQNMFDCALTSLSDLDRCSADVSAKMAEKNPAQSLIESNDLLYSVDLTSQYCPEGVCEAVIGNVVVYMDDNHISKAYGSTTYREFLRQLEEQGLDLMETQN
ncbi:acyltransferase family protein [uncultured Rothia sp.]|uniref:acyltransferase family protein n=1 Tax=uncultured Rothia sp. TaxID=316088 RepID=UPI00321636F3